MRKEKGREVSAEWGLVPAVTACRAHGSGPEPGFPRSSVSARSPFPTVSSLPLSGAVRSGRRASPSRGGSSARRSRLGAGGREEEPGAAPPHCAGAPTTARAPFSAQPGGCAYGTGRNTPRLREAGMCFGRDFKAVLQRPSNSHNLLAASAPARSDLTAFAINYFNFHFYFPTFPSPRVFLVPIQCVCTSLHVL